MVISGNPSGPFRDRFQASQLSQAPQQLVHVGNSAVEVREGHIRPRQCPEELQEAEDGSLIEAVGDGPGSIGAGDVAACGAEVGDADEEGVREGEEVSVTEVRGEREGLGRRWCCCEDNECHEEDGNRV